MIPDNEIGKVKKHWWGTRWKLSHKDVKKFNKTFNFGRKIKGASTVASIIQTGVNAATLISKILSKSPLYGFLGQLITTPLEFITFASKLKKHDKGKGVIVDFRMTYPVKGIKYVQPPIVSGYKFRSR